MSKIIIEMDQSEIRQIIDILDNKLFDNGYDLYDPYFKSLNNIKEKLNIEILRSKSKNCLID